jgi:DNA-binding response OmpR family regulator
MADPRKKILCIEDDHEVAALIAEELVDQGFEVSLAHDGLEGYLAILSETPDLVLSDVDLPVMSGFEVLEHLTAYAPRFGNVPFVFLVATNDRDSGPKGRELAAGEYVTKPIDFEILGSTITSRLSAWRPPDRLPANQN